MSKGYLLDTNIVIALLMNEGNVINFLKQAAQDKMLVFFSTITECEVFSGLKPDEHLRAEMLFKPKRCLNVTSDVARLAGAIRRDQKVIGRKLKTPDALIIATAMINELILVSRDSDMSFVQSVLKCSCIKI